MHKNASITEAIITLLLGTILLCIICAIQGYQIEDLKDRVTLLEISLKEGE